MSTDTTGSRSLVLIERDATSLGGHWYRAALALTRAARHRGRSVAVVALGGIDAHACAELTRAGAEVITSPDRAALTARVLHHLARRGIQTSRAARRPCRHRRFPHQITLLARCAAEAAALRVAADREPGAVPILLSASEGLPALTALWGGPHVRITHDVITTQDRALRLLDHATRRGRDRVAVVCPTQAVRTKVLREHPGISTLVQPFALTEAGERITDRERATARECFAIAADQTVITLVGGWWPHKDIATIDAALGQLTAQPHLLVAGEPLDQGVLARWAALLGRGLRVHHHALTGLQLRTIYAATDLLLVARHPGAGTESGLVCDAARHGLALVISDHDPQLCRALAGQPWLRSFTAGDPSSLASVLDAALAMPPIRPGPEAIGLLGLLTPDQALRAYTELHRGLPATGAR